MYEALCEIAKRIENICGSDECDDREISKIGALIKQTLAETPRNCDVGTAEEQAVRYMNFCHNYPKCTGCPCVGRVQYHQCEFVWAQLPYEKGGAK